MKIGQDALTRFSLDAPPATLAESIKELGITHPLLLAPQGENYQIVCGHRRAECARRLGMDTVPAFVPASAPSPADAILRNLTENRPHRVYSDMEKALIIRKLAGAAVREKEIIQEYLPRLDLERSKKLFEDLKQCAGFSESLALLLHQLNLPLRVLTPLFRWDADSRNALEPLLAALRPGVNKCRELIELADETAVKDGEPPRALLNRDAIQKPLQDADLSSHEKYDAIHKQLRLWRYPVLTDLQRRVYRAIDQLQLDGRIQLRTPQNFEGDRFKIELTFTTREELVQQVERLFRVTDAEALDDLIQIFREISKG
ncbi:MAG: ParB N-terminal domain-containing protein [Nitrospinaceae bacterium]|nr:ParB N-terminal domain-containing protein [Nitrospinaceae bacterium]NIR54877.1 ParB N-terminal domain-containing protein [Nitrospinaceae bacterium]NIT82115.1 ParB N-terminal domain-containing protein [Nitrospinaceae bacterium]NIW05971.1 ParB N-terminal domain-containing protein [Nitrospinaceae bacterium]NIX34508.1 ParB N-terminal domain-containing protein [Nitrospinaceae bacterium]